MRTRSAKPLDPEKRPRCAARPEEAGGATRSRTGLDGFAIRCITDLLSRHGLHPRLAVHSDKKGKPGLPFFCKWSGRRVSNSRPQPWQGCALPTELLPHWITLLCDLVDVLCGASTALIIGRNDRVSQPTFRLRRRHRRAFNVSTGQGQRSSRAQPLQL